MIYSKLPIFKFVLLPLLGIVTISAMSQDSDAQEPTTRRLRIENLAKAIQGGDGIVISSLVDEIFAINAELPESSSKTLRDRVVRAELRFGTGRHQAITTQQIVDGINHLVRTFGTPPYTATSANQINQLRSRLLVQFPTLLSSTQHGQELAEGTFSPAQALFLEMVMIRQKAFNPDYQVPPNQLLPQPSRHTRQERSQAVQQFKNNPKANEVRAAIASHVTTTPADAERIGHEVLDRSGVER